jgi:hypothetical protein
LELYATTVLRYTLRHANIHCHFGKQEITMKIIAATLALLWATAAQANCSTYTVTINGKTYTCTECCMGTGQFRTCNTTCR